MNFFQDQEEARRNTRVLVALFMLAVLGIIAVVYAVSLPFFHSEGIDLFDPESIRPALWWWNPNLLMKTSIPVVGVIGLVSVTKLISLSKGGSVVAEMMGGRLIAPGSQEPRERQLMNVVEEMSIASGVSMPQVYILDEEGINAFAAGYSPEDAAVAVTKGALRAFNREQLQGVIAHEFSHVLNGDMKLNIRLIGVLAGIVAIAGIGRFFIWMAANSSRRRSSKSSEGAIPFFLVGLAIWLIGSLGALFAKIIQSAVSRQREYLADASAVQFTRNPEGIGGALKTILAASSGSKLNASATGDIAHLCIANPVSSLFSMNFFATHPPLEKRILKLGLDPEGLTDSVGQQDMDGRTDGASGFAGSSPSIVDTAGYVGPQEIENAATILERIPSELMEASRSGLGATSIIYALLLDHEATIRDRQVTVLKQRLSNGQLHELQRVLSHLGALQSEYAFSLLELAAGGLGTLSGNQLAQTIETVEQLVDADDHLSLYEFAVRSVIQAKLSGRFAPAQSKGKLLTKGRQIASACEDVLSACAYAGHDDVQTVHSAFRSARQYLPVGAREIADLEPDDDHRFERLDAALSRIRQATPGLKRSVLQACEACVVFDGEVRLAEANLLHAIALAIGVPVPPIVQPL